MSEIVRRCGSGVVALALLTACGSGSSGSDTEPSGGSAGTSANPSSGGTGGSSTSGGSGGSGTGGSETGGAGTGGSAGAPIAGASGDDPAPGSYGNRAELPEANSEMAVAEVNGKIYVLGGYPQSRVTMPTVIVYDIATNSWDYSEPLPFAVHHPVAVGVGGKLYSLGGQTDDGDTNRVIVFDPSNPGPWSDLAPMPTARGGGAAAVIDDRIYVAGGRPPAGNAFEVYDVGDDAWTVLPDLPDAAHPDRNHLAAAAIGGKIYVAGGRYGGGSFVDPMTAQLDVFDPATGEWSPAAPMPRPRGGVNGVAALGCFFVWGGEGADIGEPNDVFPDHDVYDPRTNGWTRLADLPTPIHGVTGAVFYDGLIYMPGGGIRQGGSSGSTSFQVYRPDTRCE